MSCLNCQIHLMFLYHPIKIDYDSSILQQPIK